MQNRSKILTAVLAATVALMFLGAAAVVPGDDESSAEGEGSLPVMPLKDTADMLLQRGALYVTDMPEAVENKVIYITDNLTVNGDTDSYIGKTVVFQGNDAEDPVTVTIADGYGLKADAIYFDGNVDIDFGKYSYLYSKMYSLGALSLIKDTNYVYMTSEDVVYLDVDIDTTIPAYIAATEEDRMNMSMTLDMDVSIQAHNDIVFFSEEYTGSGTTNTPDAVDGVVDETETIKDGTVNSQQLILHPAENLALLDMDISADFTYFYRNLPDIDNDDVPNILMWFYDNRVFPDIEGSFLLTDMSAFDYECDGTGNSVDFTVHTYTVYGVEAYSELSVDTVNYGDSHEIYVQAVQGTFDLVNDTSSFQPNADISVGTVSYTSRSVTDKTTYKGTQEDSVTAEIGGLNILFEANSAEKVDLSASVGSVAFSAESTETDDSGKTTDTLAEVNAANLSFEFTTTVSGLSAVYDLMASEDDSKTAASKFQTSSANVGIGLSVTAESAWATTSETVTPSGAASKTAEGFALGMSNAKVGINISADGNVGLSAGAGSFGYVTTHDSYTKVDGEFVLKSSHTLEIDATGASITANGKLSNAKYVLGYLLKESSQEKPDIEASTVLSSVMADSSLQIDASIDSFEYSDVSTGTGTETTNVKIANSDSKSTGNLTVSANVTAKTGLSGLQFSAYALLDTKSGTYLSVLHDEYAVNWYRDGQNILVNDVDFTVTASAGISIADLVAKGEDAFGSAIVFEAILGGDVTVTQWATIGDEADLSDNELYISEFAIEGIGLTTSDPSMKTYTAAADLVKFNQYYTVWNDYTGSVLDLMDTLDADLSVEASNLTLGEDTFSAISATVIEKGKDAVNYVRGESVQQIACYIDVEKKLFNPEDDKDYEYAEVQIISIDASNISTEKGLVIAIRAAPVTSETTTSDTGASVTIQATEDEEVVIDSSALTALISAVTEGKTATLTVDSAKDDGVSVTFEKSSVSDLVSKNASLEIKASKGTLLLDATAVKTLSDATTGSLNLTVSTVSETEIRAQVSSALADSVAGRTVISITNSSGVHQLNGTMTFTVPYELQDSSKTVKVLYLNTETNRLEEIDCSYDAESKTVTGTVDHMSLYAIEETEATVGDDTDDDSDSDSKSNTGLYIGIGVGVVAVVALAGVAFFLIRKR